MIDTQTTTDLAAQQEAWNEYVDTINEDHKYERACTILDRYQKFTPTTAAYPPEYAFAYLIPGLVEEAGEVAGKYAKMVRKYGVADPYEIDDPIKWCEFVTAMQKEMGDVMWMLSEIHNNLEIFMTDTVVMNRDKLIDRQNRDVIVGEGDNR